MNKNLEIFLGKHGKAIKWGGDRGPLTPLSSLNILRHIAVYICIVRWICRIYYQVLKLRWIV